MQRTLTGLAVLAMLFVASGAAEDSSSAPISQYASADDLAKLIGEYGERVGEATVSAEEFEAKGSRMVRDARTVAVLATALGMSDQDHALKAAAPAIVAAAKKAAEAKELPAAKAADEELKKALAGEATSTDALSFENTKALGQLMKQVSFVHTRLKRNVKKLDRYQEQSALDATLLAVIGQAIDADTHEVKDPAQTPDWHKYAAEMRDSFAELSAKVKAGDTAGIESAMKRVQDNCDACHHTFPHE